MNIRTTALLAFSASASEKDFPSIVVSWKFGAAAPIAGPSARAAPARATEAAKQRAILQGFHHTLLLEWLESEPRDRLFPRRGRSQPRRGRSQRRRGGPASRAAIRPSSDSTRRWRSRSAWPSAAPASRTRSTSSRSASLSPRDMSDRRTSASPRPSTSVSRRTVANALDVPGAVPPMSAGGLANVEEAGKLPLVEAERRDRDAGPFRDRGDRKTVGLGRHRLAEDAPAYTAKSGRITTGSNFHRYL